MSRRLRKRLLPAALAVGALLLAGACAPVGSVEKDALAALRQPDGTVIWQQEFRFEPPPSPWQLISLDEDDFSLGFMRECASGYPCQSTMAYAEEPFGYSRDFRERQAEYFKRFLWASRVVFAPPQLREVTVRGEAALEAITEGVEPVLGHKVRAKVVFTRRGERVVVFSYTQWRAREQAFDLTETAAFDRFVESFRFLQPSFYERLAN